VKSQKKSVFRYFLGSLANGWLTPSLYDEHQ
jgi:hypothetical protein